MDRLIAWAGNGAAVAGVLCCLGSGAARLGGGHYLGGFALDTLFSLGTGLMVMGCLAKLHALGRAG